MHFTLSDAKKHIVDANIDIEQIKMDANNCKEIGISAIIMTYNEIRCIKRCIESIKNLVDEVIVIDTESNDGTFELLNEIDGITVYSEKWENNFASIRNRLISYASNEWILMIDADEYVSSHSKISKKELKNILKCMDVNGIMVVSPVLNDIVNKKEYFFTSRIFKKMNTLKFYGNVHEELRHNNISIDTYVTIDLILEHDGYDKIILQEKNKYERNSQLLKLCISEEPYNPRWKYFYILEEYCAGKNMDKLKEEIDGLNIDELSPILKVKALELKCNIYLLNHSNISYLTEQLKEVAPNCIDWIYFKSLQTYQENISNINKAIKDTCKSLEICNGKEMYSVIDNEYQHIYKLLREMSCLIGNEEFINIFSKKIRR